MDPTYPSPVLLHRPPPSRSSSPHPGDKSEWGSGNTKNKRQGRVSQVELGEDG